MNVIRLCAMAAVAMLVLSSDAFAFGKRFSRGSSCSSGSCGTASGSSCAAGSSTSVRSGQSCSSCAVGSCATGSCAVGCENGQCSTGTTYCVDGKCYTAEQFAKQFPQSTGSGTLGSKAVTFPLTPNTITLHKEGDAWKDTSGNVWKK